MSDTYVKGPSTFYLLEINNGGIRDADNPKNIAIGASTETGDFIIPESEDSPMQKDGIYFNLTRFVDAPTGEGVSFEGRAIANGWQYEGKVEDAFVEATGAITKIKMKDQVSGKASEITPMRINEINPRQLYAEQLTLGT